MAKLAVLETVPEGWEEFIDPGGRTLYRNLAQGCVLLPHHVSRLAPHMLSLINTTSAKLMEH